MAIGFLIPKCLQKNSFFERVIWLKYDIYSQGRRQPVSFNISLNKYYLFILALLLTGHVLQYKMTRWHDIIIVWRKKLLLCCQDQPSDDFVHLKNLSTGGALRQGWLFSDSGLRDICPTIWHSHKWTGAQIWYLSKLKLNAIIAPEKLLHAQGHKCSLQETFPF